LGHGAIFALCFLTNLLVRSKPDLLECSYQGNSFRLRRHCQAWNHREEFRTGAAEAIGTYAQEDFQVMPGWGRHGILTSAERTIRSAVSPVASETMKVRSITIALLHSIPSVRTTQSCRPVPPCRPQKCPVSITRGATGTLITCKANLAHWPGAQLLLHSRLLPQLRSRIRGGGY
jgi:hypothetical protein